MMDYRNLPRSLPPEELRRLLREFNNNYCRNTAQDHVKLLKDLLELAERQWHTGRMLDKDMLVWTEDLMFSMVDVQKKAEVELALKIIPRLGFKYLLLHLLAARETIADPCIVEKIEECAARYGSHVADSYYGIPGEHNQVLPMENCNMPCYLDAEYIYYMLADCMQAYYEEPAADREGLLALLWELSDQQWHSYWKLDGEMLRQVEDLLMEIVDFESESEMRSLLQIIPRLGAKRLFDRVMEKRTVIANPRIIQEIEKSIAEYGTDVEDPYASLGPRVGEDCGRGSDGPDDYKRWRRVAWMKF